MPVIAIGEFQGILGGLGGGSASAAVNLLQSDDEDLGLQISFAGADAGWTLEGQDRGAGSLTFTVDEENKDIVLSYAATDTFAEIKAVIDAVAGASSIYIGETEGTATPEEPPFSKRPFVLAEPFGPESAGGGGGTPAAIIRSGTSRDAIGDVRAEGLFIGLEHEDVGPDWGLVGAARRTTPVQASIRYSDGANVLVITIPTAVASGTAGNAWTVSTSSGAATAASVDAANMRLNIVNASGGTQTWADVRNAVNGITGWSGSAAVTGNAGQASGNIGNGSFENGLDPEAIGAEVDETAMTVTVSYASTDTVQDVRDALHNLELANTTLKARELHGTTLSAALESPPFDARPFSGFFAQGASPSSPSTGTQQHISGSFADDGSLLTLNLSPGNTAEVAVPDALREAGGGSREIDVKTSSSYIITDDDEGKLLLFNGTSAATFGLPDIASVGEGWTIAIASLSSYALTIGVTGVATIYTSGGDTNIDLRRYQSITLQAATSNIWLVVQDNRETDISGKSDTGHTHDIDDLVFNDFGTSGTVQDSHRGQIVRKTGSGAGTVELPLVGTAVGQVAQGFHVWLMNANSGNLTVDPRTSRTINGSSTHTIPPGHAVRLVVTSNTTWQTIANTQVGASSSGITQSAADSRYVNTSGDTMTGLLTLSGAPTANLHAATKKYVDDNAGTGGGSSAVNDQNSDYTIVAGDEDDTVRFTGTSDVTYTAPDIDGTDVQTGFRVYVANNSSDSIVRLDGDGADTIDGVAGVDVLPGVTIGIQAVTASSWTVFDLTHDGGANYQRIEIPASATRIVMGVQGESGFASSGDIRPNGALSGTDYRMDYRDVRGKLFVVKGSTGDFNVHMADLFFIHSGTIDISEGYGSIEGTVFYIQNDRSTSGNVTFSGGGIADIRPSSAQGGAVVTPGYTAFVTLNPHGSGRYMLGVNAFSRAPGNASSTARGLVELATNSETQTGTDASRAVTPAGLSSRTATQTRRGVVELATNSETQAGTDSERAVTPANLNSRSATESRTGLVEIATNAEADAGTDDERAMTPSKTRRVVGDQVSSNERTAGTETGIRRFSPADIAAMVPEHQSHDSSSATPDTPSQDHERISRLEALTSELSLHDHTNWTDETDVTDYAIFLLPEATAINLGSLAGYGWALSQTVSSAGSYKLLLRRALTSSQAGARVRRVDSGDSEVAVYHGDFVRFRTIGSYEYLIRTNPGTYNLVLNDVLTVQTTTETHTEFDGHSGPLETHEAASDPHSQYATDEDLANHAAADDPHSQYATDDDLANHASFPYIHQDSPSRTDGLSINAPVGREVYLTESHNHPGTEHIFYAPASELDSANSIFGVSAVDLSSLTNGPPAASDPSGYPSVFGTNRLAAIWQVDEEETVRVAVASVAGTPTVLHVNGRREQIAGSDYETRVDLTQESLQTVGAIEYRIMTGPLRAFFMDDLSGNGLAELRRLHFSLEFAGGFMEADGSIDTGTTQAVGHYESEGGGVWKTRANAILDELTTLLGAADADVKQRLLDALNYEEVLYEETSDTPIRTDQNWVVIDLARNVVAGDDNKRMYVEVVNAAMRWEGSFRVAEWRTLATQDMSSGINITPSIPLIAPRGFNLTRNHEEVTLFYIGRPTEDPQTTNKLGILADRLSTASTNNWGVTRMKISLRGH